MKLFSRKNIAILVLLITIIVLIKSSHYAYLRYFDYHVFEKKLQERELFNSANQLLKFLEKERLDSIHYLTSPNQRTLHKLKLQREKVNLKIQKNKDLKLNKIKKELFSIRKNIDARSIQYNEFIYDIFHLSIIKPIILKMKKLKVFDNVHSELQFIELRENITMENSFLAFILQQKTPMENDDIFFWEKILELRQAPTLDLIKNEILQASVQDAYNKNTFFKIPEQEKVQLFISAKSKTYPIKFQQWVKKTSLQKKKLNQAQKILANYNTRYLNKKLFSYQGEMYRSTIISLLIFFLVILLLTIINIINTMDKDQAILKNTVKEIQVDLDENKKKEIKEILTHNSSIEVYEFLAKEIREPSRAKDLFLANMSHEIRTPLNGIIGFTKELQETTLSEEQVEIVSIIEESSENLMHIVNDILDFSKIKVGKIKLEKISFDPIEKVEASIDTFVAKAREKEIELKVCIDPNIPTKVIGDPTKIIQILSNLISNAIKFTPKYGSIEININQILDASQNKNFKLQFSIKDSGIGVSNKEKKEIFDAFSQADASTSRKYGGTGLGLSIASQFITYMGGELNIESELGEGSRFFFNIILEKPKTVLVRPKENLSTYTIGYIPPMGNRSIDKNLKTYVEYQDATFLTYTQRSLLNLIESELPDLLFIDYKCFDKEGELEYFLDLPLKVVLIVADNREKELRKIRHKIDKILHKPVNFTRTLKSLEILTKIEKKSLKKEKTTTQKFHNIHALVAEDNFINQKLMKSVLNRFGMNVTVVSNGEEALLSRKNNKYDIVFMDIQMPIMGGVEATKHILAFEEKAQRKHIPIVALTANALEGDKEKYIALGMDAYLPKPMDLKELTKVLNHFVGS